LATLSIGAIYRVQHNYDKALAQIQKAQAIDPNYPISNLALYSAYRDQGMDEKAADALERLLGGIGRAEEASELKKAFAAGGMQALLRKEIEFTSNPASPVYDPVSAAQNYSLLGEKDKAFFWLDKAYDNHQI
jgi:tetratricopeptide (TPR) repeat protein